jgi:hypothetical protein
MSETPHAITDQGLVFAHSNLSQKEIVDFYDIIEKDYDEVRHLKPQSDVQNRTEQHFATARNPHRAAVARKSHRNF